MKMTRKKFRIEIKSGKKRDVILFKVDPYLCENIFTEIASIGSLKI